MTTGGTAITVSESDRAVKLLVQRLTQNSQCTDRGCILSTSHRACTMHGTPVTHMEAEAEAELGLKPALEIAVLGHSVQPAAVGDLLPLEVVVKEVEHVVVVVAAEEEEDAVEVEVVEAVEGEVVAEVVEEEEEEVKVEGW